MTININSYCRNIESKKFRFSDELGKWAYYMCDKFESFVEKFVKWIWILNEFIQMTFIFLKSVNLSLSLSRILCVYWSWRWFLHFVRFAFCVHRIYFFWVCCCRFEWQHVRNEFLRMHVILLRQVNYTIHWIQ